MRWLLLTSTCVALLFVGTILGGGQLWTAAILATSVALLSSLLYVLRSVRQMANALRRRLTTTTILLLFGVVVSQWVLAGLQRAESGQKMKAEDAHFIVHRMAMGMATSAVQPAMIFKKYFAQPATHRVPFGLFARQSLLNKSGDPFFRNAQDRFHPLEILSSPDSVLIVRVKVVLPPLVVANGDSVAAEGRLILTEHGGDYVIDR
jgi:hypothetical protein